LLSGKKERRAGRKDWEKFESDREDEEEIPMKIFPSEGHLELVRTFEGEKVR